VIHGMEPAGVLGHRRRISGDRNVQTSSVPLKPQVKGYRGQLGEVGKEKQLHGQKVVRRWGKPLRLYRIETNWLALPGGPTD